MKKYKKAFIQVICFVPIVVIVLLACVLVLVSLILMYKPLAIYLHDFLVRLLESIKEIYEIKDEDLFK